MSTRLVNKLWRIALLVILGWGQAQAQDAEAGYQFASGDRLKITVYGHDDLSGEFEIDGAGEISMPLIGEIRAAGLTSDQLEDSIIDALQPDYLKHPRVSIEILSFRPYYILGEVNSPGSYPYVSGMTVLNAVAMAGGFTYRARKNRITITRTAGEEARRTEVSLSTLVLPGDVIEVPERFF